MMQNGGGLRTPRFFWATAVGTDARRVEEKLARESGLQLTECKHVEAMARGTLAGQQTTVEKKEQEKMHLGESLPREILRCILVRDVYLELPDHAGQPGAAFILMAIERALHAMANNEAVAMLQAHVELKDVSF